MSTWSRTRTAALAPLREEEAFRALRDSVDLRGLAAKALALEQIREAMEAKEGKVSAGELARAERAMAEFLDASSVITEQATILGPKAGMTVPPKVVEYWRLVRQGRIVYAVGVVLLTVVVSRMLGLYG